MSWGWRSWRSGLDPVRQAWCVGWLIRTSGVVGVVWGRVIRRLVHVLFGWRSTTLSWLGPGRPGCSTWSRAAPKPRSKAWLAQRPQGVVRWGRGGRDGRVHRGHDRRQRGTPNRQTATAVMGPFLAVRLARGALDQCRRRVQQELHGLDNYRLRMLLIAGGLHPQR